MASRYKYSAYEQQDRRRVRPEVVFSAALVFFFLVGMGFVFFDLSRHPDITDESNNKAILGEFVSSQDEYKTIETDDYTVDVPIDWVQVNSPQVLINGTYYYPDRFQGVTGSDLGRWFEVYKKKLPDAPVDKVLNVEPRGDSLIVGSISPQCRSFVITEDNKKPVDNSYTRATWDAEKMEFLCTMGESTNVIAAFTPKSTTVNGVVLESSTKAARYLFIFGDHGSREDNSIFQQILRSFKLK
jgi:hypothetical protein